MIGYIQKDQGLATFEMDTHNISEAELAAVRSPQSCMLLLTADAKHITLIILRLQSGRLQLLRQSATG